MKEQHSKTFVYRDDHVAEKRGWHWVPTRVLSDHLRARPDTLRIIWAAGPRPFIGFYHKQARAAELIGDILSEGMARDIDVSNECQYMCEFRK